MAEVAMRLPASLAYGVSFDFEAVLLYVCQDWNRNRQRPPVARGSMGAPHREAMHSIVRGEANEGTTARSQASTSKVCS